MNTFSGKRVTLIMKLFDDEDTASVLQLLHPKTQENYDLWDTHDDVIITS